VEKLKKRFETVPVAEVLKNATEIDIKKRAEKVVTKEEPYSVPTKTGCRAAGR
jgi:hypothetical protein